MKQIRELKKELFEALADAGVEHDRRHQSWAKAVTAVGTQTNGYAFEGKFVKDGTVEVDIQPTVFLVMTTTGSRKYQTREYSVVLMDAEGGLTVTDVRTTSETSGWALRIREQVRALVEAKLAGETNDGDEREAIDAFLGAMDECRDHLVIVEQVIEDHLAQLPESVNWASVGDAHRLRDQLAEIVEWARARGGP